MQNEYGKDVCEALWSYIRVIYLSEISAMTSGEWVARMS
jgi:hypothetical protein